MTVGGAGNAPNPGGDPSSNPDGEVALDIEVAAAAYSVATGQAGDDPGLLGGRDRLGVDGDGDLGGRGRRLRRLLDLLGLGRGQLAGRREGRRASISPAN